ncbi:SGNH/GDSL hydrolase family protein [Bacillus thuringiensis]
MADAPKLLPTDSLRVGYPKINQSIENANEALRRYTEIDYQRSTLSAGIIGSNRVWEKTALVTSISGMTAKFENNIEQSYGKKLLTLTVTNTSNFKQLINPGVPEQAALGVSIPPYYQRYKKISMALNYKIIKASGTRQISVAVAIQYTDGTSTNVLIPLKADSSEYAEIFEQSFDNKKSISNVYYYVSGGDIGDIIKISYVSYWFGNTNDNPFDRELLQSRIDDSVDIVSNKIGRENWFTEAKNIITNKPVTNTNIQISTDFKINGVKSLATLNAQKTPFWLEMECVSSNATPIIQIPIHELIKKLRSLKSKGFILPKVNVRLQINFDYVAAHVLTMQLLSKKTSDNTFYYFTPTTFIKQNGKETAIIELSNDIDSIIDTLQDWLVVYVVFKTNINTNKINLGWVDVWFDDDKHVLQEGYIEGKEIKPGTLTETAIDSAFFKKVNKPAIESYNWCSYVPDFVYKGISPSGDFISPSANFSYLGVAQLPGVKNSRGTEYWIDWKGVTSVATPFGFIKSKELIESLVAAEGKGKKIPKVNFEVEIYLPYDESHNVEIQGIGDRDSGWFYFTNQTLTKPFGPYTMKASGTMEIGTNSWTTIKSWIGLYFTFKQSLQDKHVYFGDFSIWVDDDEKHTFLPEFIDGKTIVKETISKDKLDQSLQDKLTSLSAAKNTLANPKKVAFVGDSVTWGDGYLSDGYVKVLDQLIRGNQGQILLSDSNDMTYNGTNSFISNKKFYNEKAVKISGANSSVNFTLKSNEVHICQAIERGLGNTILDVYVDGVLFDTIENKNRRPSGTETKTFAGDGAKVKFDLGRAFTYNHAVTVDGVAKVGGLNTQGYGGTFPVGSDYMVIKQNVVNANGDDEIHHILWFKTAPASGTNISVAQKYGESISYTRSHIGENGALFSDGLESAYGDGNTSFDPANPSTLSSGLDFRYVDSESFISYKFSSVDTRQFEIKVRGLAPEATGTPYFIFNFATDFRFEYMNAGIGGYTYALFDKDTSLTSYRKFMEYEPDFITILLGTNDDWNAATYPVTQSKVIKDFELTNSSYYGYGSVTNGGNGNYNVTDRWVDTNRITKYTVKLADSVTVGTITKGDILIVNKWTNDERYCQVRLVDSYDVSTKTIKFTTPLNLDTLPDDCKVMIKSISQYETNLMSIITKVQAYNPKIPVHLVGMGVPNGNHRQLLGYREVIRNIANSQGWDFIDLYTETSRYLATNKRDKSYTITSTGVTTYLIDNTLNPLLRNVRVTVDGKQMNVGKDVFITGGYGYYYNSDLTYGYATRPTNISFVTPPVSGAIIKVEGTTATWSTDYTHMSNDAGKYIYGEGIYKSIKKHF